MSSDDEMAKRLQLRKMGVIFVDMRHLGWYSVAIPSAIFYAALIIHHSRPADPIGDKRRSVALTADEAVQAALEWSPYTMPALVGCLTAPGRAKVAVM